MEEAVDSKIHVDFGNLTYIEKCFCLRIGGQPVFDGVKSQRTDEKLEAQGI